MVYASPLLLQQLQYSADQCQPRYHQQNVGQTGFSMALSGSVTENFEFSRQPHRIPHRSGCS